MSGTGRPLEDARLDLLRSLAAMRDIRAETGSPLFPDWMRLSSAMSDFVTLRWTFDDMKLAQREAALLRQIESIAVVGALGALDYEMRITPLGYRFIQQRDADGGAQRLTASGDRQ